MNGINAEKVDTGDQGTQGIQATAGVDGSTGINKKNAEKVAT